jgi:hypothetical protein
MDTKEPVNFDAATRTLLKAALDDAWDCLRPEQQAKLLKTTLADRILKAAAQGERNHEHLVAAALTDISA